MKAFGIRGAGPRPGLRTLAVSAIWLASAVALRLAGGSFVEILILAAGAFAITVALTSFEGSASLRAIEMGRRLALRDDATQLASGELAQHFMAIEYAAAQRGRTVTLVLFGFDHFDEFTDQHNAAAAEMAVREFGRVLNRLTRKMHLSARYGWRADTFLSVLSDTESKGAAIFFEHIRHELEVVRNHRPMPTVSAGIAEFDPSMASPEAFVRSAEAALEAARTAGGDCARIHAGPDLPEDRSRRLRAL